MATGVLRTNDTNNKELREDLLDIITNISPVATPILSTLGTSTATQSIHQWLKDSIARKTSVSADAEGTNFSASTPTAPTRVTNYTQEIKESFRVSWKQKQSEVAGYDDPMAYYGAKALKSWKLNAEYALLFGTGTSGASGTGWEMTGLKKAITTNFVSMPSGATVTESAFNDWMELAFDNVTDRNFNVYSSMKVKRGISAFTASNTKNIEAAKAMLVNRIDVYDGDTGYFNLYPHWDIPATGNTGFLLAIQPDAFKVAYLAKPQMVDVPSLGAYDEKAVWGILTLEYRDESAGVRVDNLLR